MNDSLENLLFYFANFSESMKERKRALNGRNLELKIAHFGAKLCSGR